jgi:UDP-2-acetamido-2,6-beta-L-arabino-hexul-4-ose reductase
VTAVRALVTGSQGFIGRNLVVRLREAPGIDPAEWHRGLPPAALAERIAEADVIIHLAGVNRPQDPREFAAGNTDLTRALVEAAAASGRAIPILLASSTQAAQDNPYGRSKLAAEEIVADYARAQGVVCRIYRLPNVFGKWSRPRYNSAVATFCHNVVHDLPIEVHDPASPLRLVYIDDICDEFVAAIREVVSPAATVGASQGTVEPVYETTVGHVAAMIQTFGRDRGAATVGRVGAGLERALYATFLSFLPSSQFSYAVQRHVDPRGEFAEVVRTADSGQVSYFTAHPGITRGGHYHHTKNEKFLVLRGHARFRFENLTTGESHALETCGDEPRVVETVPGWAHDITNIGSEEMLVMLWANEAFDPAKPDTVARALHG